MKIMPKSTKEEKLRWIKPILDKEIMIKDMTKVCPFSERSLKYWLASYRTKGLIGLENRSTRPKSSPKELPIRIKQRIIEKRTETDLSAHKICWQLRKEGISVSPRAVGKILEGEGLVRRYRRKKIRPYPAKQWQPGELVEIDIKWVPKRIKGLRYYQFTAIDCSTRWRYLQIYEDQGNNSALCFLETLIRIAPFEIKAVKTDNGSCFTNRYNGYLKSTDPINPRLHPFDLECQKHKIVHYLIDPGKPAQNGKVERSHRSDQESFYDRVTFKSAEELKYKLRLWNMYYNNLEHYSLNGRTPNEALRDRVQNVCA